MFLGLILTPTRELAIQIHRECRKLATGVGIGAVCVYGGTGISEQIAELKRGTEIIVCTPGRMIDMLAANNGKRVDLFYLIAKVDSNAAIYYYFSVQWGGYYN